jgi:hypothetical protein
LSGGDAISRVLEGRRARRRLGPSDADWEYDEKLRLGGELLFVLADLLGDPNQVESLRLFLGLEVKPITLLSRDLGGLGEEFMIDLEGRLMYRSVEIQRDFKEEETPKERRIVLAGPRDFCKLDLEFVSMLHVVVAKEDFLERLSWRLGREGKPGYCSQGFEEESETWRVIAADPGEYTRRFQRWKRRYAARESGF